MASYSIDIVDSTPGGPYNIYYDTVSTLTQVGANLFIPDFPFIVTVPDTATLIVLENGAPFCGNIVVQPIPGIGSPTPTPTATTSITPTITPSNSLTPSITPSNSPTPSITPTNTPTPSITPSVTRTPRPTISPTRTLTPTRTPENTPTNTSTPTTTPVNSNTPTPTMTITPTSTPVASSTPTPTPTDECGQLAGYIICGATPTPTPTSTTTPTKTPTNTPTRTATPTTTGSPTITPTNTPTQTKTPTNTPTLPNLNCPVIPSPSALNVRYATVADSLTIPNANVGDLLILGGTQTSAGLPAINISGGPLALSPGKKILIRGGIRYDFIRISTSTSGTVGNPIVITNFCGQVETRTFHIEGMSYFKLTGKYDPVNKTGDVNYQGHDAGYAWSQGTYGIFINNRWQNTTGTLLQIDGVDIGGTVYHASNYEVEYIESGNGGYTNQSIDNRYAVVENILIHDCYFHDISGEGLYWGYFTGVDTFEVYKGIKVYNNRFIRCGYDGVQVKRMVSGSDIYNNAIVNVGLDNEQGQDLGVNLAITDGGTSFKNNLLVGTMGYAGIQYFFESVLNYPPTEGTASCDNNAVLHIGMYDPANRGSDEFSGARGLFLRGPSYNVTYPPLTADIKNNVFGFFLSPNSNTNLVENGMENSPTSPLLFRDNIYDNTGDITTFVGGTDWTINSNNVQTTVEEAQMENYYIGPGFDHHRFMYWDSLAPYDNTWYVTYKSKIYRAIATSTGIEPGATAGWEAYWEVQTYNGGTTYYPADDVRITAGTFYNTRGIGLLDNP